MTNGRTMWIAMLLGCGIFAGAGRAETTVETLPPKFAVWTSFGCSRSLHRRSEFATLSDALDAAEKLRSAQSFVFVMPHDSTWSDAFPALSALRTSETALKTLRGEIYVRSPRCGNWRRSVPSDTADFAERLAGVQKSETTLAVFERIPRE